MTDAEWATCTDPTPMLGFLRQSGKLSKRKWRLFGVACCHRIRHLLADERSRRALGVAERYADGDATDDELDASFEAAFDAGAELAEEKGRDPAAFVAAGRDPLRAAAWGASSAAHPDESADDVAFEAADATGTPGEEEAQCELLRCLFGDPLRSPPVEPPWLTPTVKGLAEGIYRDGAFGRLPILAAALQDAGCDDPAILDHCRPDRTHARGCWVIDLVLGKG
jgi:hypothetical protein